MKSQLDKEESEASEITLSTASLLGIFFGLVLVCGVFFWFGYSMGRGTGGTEAPTGSATAANATEPPPAAAEPALASAEQERPQSPAVATPSPVSQASRIARDDSAAADDGHGDAPREASAVPRRAVLSKPSAAQQAAVPVIPTPSVMATSASSGQPMVQIAAVARQDDADALVSALRQRGYGVVVRNEPQDKLLHVQVGPFADRTQAAAMKQKLLSDGYNAIIKQ